MSERLRGPLTEAEVFEKRNANIEREEYRRGLQEQGLAFINDDEELVLKPGFFIQAQQPDEARG